MAKCEPSCTCRRHVKRTAEQRAAIGAKISAAKMGHEVSAEARAKIGAATRGRVPSAETLERQRAAMLARPGAHGHGGRGAARSPEYRTWSSMIQRCHNPRNARYSSYGGRGIEVCERWRASYVAFWEDMGPKPEPKSQYSIERIDNNGPYAPENCKWADRSTQQKNRPNFNPDKRSGHSNHRTRGRV